MPLQNTVDLLLGRLAVREGLCTQAQVDQCLAEQKMSDPPPALGDVLVFRGYLTAIQLRDLLARQHKKVMSCPGCRLSFTVLTMSKGTSARCPRCQKILSDTPQDGPTRTDAEIATRKIRVVPAGNGTGGAGAGKTTMTCIICDHSFLGIADTMGRVRCPSCQSTFSRRV